MFGTVDNQRSSGVVIARGSICFGRSLWIINVEISTIDLSVPLGRSDHRQIRHGGFAALADALPSVVRRRACAPRARGGAGMRTMVLATLGTGVTGAGSGTRSGGGAWPAWGGARFKLVEPD